MSRTHTDVAPMLLDAKQTARALGLSVSALYAMTRDGRVPAPVVLGPRCVRWRTTDLQTWAQALPTQAEGVTP